MSKANLISVMISDIEAIKLSIQSIKFVCDEAISNCRATRRAIRVDRGLTEAPFRPVAGITKETND